MDNCFVFVEQASFCKRITARAKRAQGHMVLRQATQNSKEIRCYGLLDVHTTAHKNDVYLPNCLNGLGRRHP